MIQAVQANNLTFNAVTALPKSCCLKFKEMAAKAWEAFKRAIHTLLKPFYRCWYNRCTVKKRYAKFDELFNFVQSRARGLPADQLARGFLFEVKDNAGNSKGHIFGSMHLLPINLHYWHDAILDSFSRSTHLGLEQLFFDFDLQERENIEELAANNQFFSDPALDQNVVVQAIEQVKLASIRLGNVTAAQIAEWNETVQRRIRDMPLNLANKQKNAMNLIFYLRQFKMIVPADNFAPITAGADTRLTAAAMKQNKPIIAMENENDRNEEIKPNIFAKYRSLFGKDVEELIQERREDLQDQTQYFDMWKRGDFEAFARHRQGRIPALLNRIRDPALVQQIEHVNRARNIQIAEAIDRFARGPGKLMGVFGCDHLVEQDGVIELLRRRGWTVQQVGVAPPIPIAAAV